MKLKGLMNAYKLVVALLVCLALFHISSCAWGAITFPSSVQKRATKEKATLTLAHTSAIHRHLEGLLSLGANAPAGGGLAALGFPRHGLNETCNNALCEMLGSALSCKGLGFHLSKICTQYILGFLYECPIYPAPSELFNAPSVCIGEIAALLPPGLVNGLIPTKKVSGSEAPVNTDGEFSNDLYEADEDEDDEDNAPMLGAGIADSLTFTNIRKYLASDFSENCGRRCFQSYIEKANVFYGSCSSELRQFVNMTDNSNTNYPVPYLLETYQDFRNQVCTSNVNGSNCFSQFQKFLPDPTGNTPPPDVDIFKYDCNFFDDNGINDIVFQGICEGLEEVGCCFGNQVAMLSQSQTNQSANKVHTAIKMFQPCLLRNLAAKCSKFTNPRDFCTAGANGNMTTVSGSVVMGPTALRRDSVKLPNMYDENDVVFFQGVMSMNLLWDDNSPTKQAALQVEILNYAYFNSTIADQSNSTQLTPLDGSLYFPFTWDYLNATSARFDFQFTLQGMDQAQSATFLDELTNNQACSKGNGGGILRLLYGAGAECRNVSTVAQIFVAEPIIPQAKSAAPHHFTFNGATALIIVLMGLFMNA